MKTQNYGNHIRSYAPHHFVFYPVVLVLIAAAVRYAVKVPEDRALWIFLAALTALIGWLSFMLRQHYGMTVQDRLIFAEMRYRYFALTGERFERFEEQLSKGQVFALRFASDEELVALVQRALAEQLSPDAIKRSIQNWKGDYMRI